ncbi:MAG: hypothetical protein ABSF80_04400 [Chitinispirillaceae bacterium]|jgi:uncharacterized Zn ribbon protein
MNIRKLKGFALYGGIAFLFAFQCVNPGSGTETGNARVTAMVYNRGGSPAKHATVRFCTHDYNPQPGHSSGAVDSTTTDTNGNYSITLDSATTYTVTASSDSGLAYQDSVTTIKNETVKPPPDTLKPAGTIKGIVRLENGGDPTTVFILFMGTRTFTWPNDTSGSFTSDSMAAGTYRVRILTTLPNYKTLDMNLSVIAGTVNVLPAPIVLQFTGIPTPQNVKISYDTLKQIVTLTWDSANASLVSSYNVYRKNVGLNTVPTRINTNPVTGTVYRDSTRVQDSTYEYYVAAVNASATEGVKSTGVSVLIASYFVINSTFGTTGSGQGQFDYPSDIAIAANGDIYIVERTNNRVQVFDQAMQYKREFGGGILNSPFRITLDSLGKAYVSAAGNIFVFDLAGTIIDTLVIGKFAHDFDLGINEFYVITDGDSVSAFSYNGTLKRTWWCSQFNSGISLAVENPNRILVSSDIENMLRAFDTLGNIVDSIAIGPYPYCIALNKSNGRIYINSLDNNVGNWLKVLDGSHNIIARYKIPCMNGEPVVVGLHPDGSVYEVLGTTNQVLRLRSLLP